MQTRSLLRKIANLFKSSSESTSDTVTHYIRFHIKRGNQREQISKISSPTSPKVNQESLASTSTKPEERTRALSKGFGKVFGKLSEKMIFNKYVQIFYLLTLILGAIGVSIQFIKSSIPTLSNNRKNEWKYLYSNVRKRKIINNSNIKAFQN